MRKRIRQGVGRASKTPVRAHQFLRSLHLARVRLALARGRTEAGGSEPRLAAVFVVNSLCNGGAERVVQVMANHMCVETDTFVFTLCPPSADDYRLDPRVTRISLSSQKTAPLVLLSLRLNNYLGAVARTHRMVLATAHLPMSQAVVRLSGYSKQFILVVHGTYGVTERRLYVLAHRVILRSQRIVAVSRGLLEDDLLRRLGIRSKTVGVITNPLDTQAIDGFVASDGPPFPRGDYCLVVGRLDDQKNPVGAVRAYFESGLSDKCDLVFIGDGPLRESVATEARSLGIGERVHLLGFVNNPYTLMRDAKMLVVASDYEAMSMGILEAMYCGCPVISTAVHGVAEVFGEELPEFVAQVGDMTGLGRAMQRAYRLPPENLRVRVLDRVDPKVVVSAYEEVYARWCGVHASPR